MTSFPYIDPSPNNLPNPKLLGIRFDICSRSGKFDKAYYILLKRVNETKDEQRIHRFVIPDFIPIRDYEARYLPLQDEGYGSESSNDGAGSRSKQDLHTAVRKVRQDLVSWTLRREALEYLREELGLRSPGESDVDTDDESAGQMPALGMPPEQDGKFGVRLLSATSVEARFASIAWNDGRGGRIKISDTGQVERAVIVGDEGRDTQTEQVLVNGNIRIEEFVRVLEKLWEAWTSTRRKSGNS